MKFIRSIARFLVVWFIETLSLLITAWLVAGISINPLNDISPFVIAVAASLILGIVNLVIRPLLLLLAMPLGWAVLFLAGFFINGIVLMITSRLIPAFEVTGFGPAFLGGLVLAFVNLILLSLLRKYGAP
jgi:putative membrane protein